MAVKPSFYDCSRYQSWIVGDRALVIFKFYYQKTLHDMSNQPAPSRPWFRLPSIARPTAPIPTPTPTPEPPSQPRPALARPTFRPTPAAATSPPVSGVASVPTSPVVKAAGGVISVPTSPDPRAPAPSSSVPTSPVPTAAVLPLTTSSLPPSPTPKPAPTSSSVPTSPDPKPAPYSSVPTSPATKPVTTTSSVPTSPATKPVTTTSSVPSSPAPKPVTTTSVVPTSPVSKSVKVTSSVPTSPATEALTTNATRVPSPGPSLRTIKPAVQTPPQSPKPKSTAPPPSPLTLPPSQVKSYADLQPKIPLVAEQKTVLVQKTIDKPKVARDSQRDFTESLSSSIARLAKQENAKDVQTKEKGNRKKNSSDSEDVGIKVITIAGENKGASMEVTRSTKKQVFEGTSHFLHKKGNPKNEGSDSSSSEEGNSEKKGKNHKGKAMGPSPLSAYVNSNVQGVNNSIAYNSSCSHHDPGVHVSLSRKLSGAAELHVKDHGNGYQS